MRFVALSITAIRAGFVNWLFKKKERFMIVGEGMYRYRVVEGWGKLPEGWNFTETEVVLPPELAYGRWGSGEKIGPYQTIVFEIELIEVRN